MDYLISDIWDYFIATVSGTLEYKALVVMGLLLAVLVLAVPGRRLDDRIAFAALAAYLSLVFASTVLLRTTEHASGLSLVLFSTYTQALGGNRTYIFEILENIVLFVPAGIALGYLCRASTVVADRHDDIVKATFDYSFAGGTFENVIAIAGTALFSVGIEFMQYIYSVGVCELDDVFSNTLGILVGFFAVRLIGRVLKPSAE